MIIPGNLTEVPARGFYVHYKDRDTIPLPGLPIGLEATSIKAYELVGVGIHTEDGCTPENATMVVYRPLYRDSDIYKAGKFFWVRPLAKWLEPVDKDGYKGPRFIRVTNKVVIGILMERRDQMYVEVQDPPIKKK